MRLRTWTYGRGSARQIYLHLPRLVVSLNLVWKPRVHHGRRA